MPKVAFPFHKLGKHAMVPAKNEHIQALFAYWDALPKFLDSPRKTDFDPVDLAVKVWPRLFMVDILEGQNEYRLRLLGTYLVEAYGRDFTGARFVDSEIPNVTRSQTYRLLGDLVATQKPQHYLGPTEFRFITDYAICEQILLPLVDDKGRIAHVVGAIDFPDDFKRAGRVRYLDF